jgi:hypothetical protein
MAYQTRNESATDIEVILLVRLTATSPYGSASRNTILSVRLEWTGEDWADAGDDGGEDLSSWHVDPGEEDSAFAQSLGWLPLIN